MSTTRATSPSETLSPDSLMSRVQLAATHASRASGRAMRYGVKCAAALALATGVWLFGAAASADPVSSAQTAWAPLPASAAPALKDPREQRGREVFQQRCAACHAAIPKDGIGPPYMPAMAGTQALQARYKGAKPAELEQRTDLTADFVKAIVRNGLNSMPFFRPTELGDEDLTALGAYLTRKQR